MPTLDGMTRRRIDSRQIQQEALESMAQTIAAHFGVPVSHMRYAEYSFHNGRHWTVACGWERLIDGQWQREPWLPRGRSKTHEQGPQ